jgi:hypothetical protein
MAGYTVNFTCFVFGFEMLKQASYVILFLTGVQKNLPKKQLLTCHVRPSVCMEQGILTVRIFLKLHIWDFYKNVPTFSSFD